MTLTTNQARVNRAINAHSNVLSAGPLECSGALTGVP